MIKINMSHADAFPSPSIADKVLAAFRKKQNAIMQKAHSKHVADLTREEVFAIAFCSGAAVEPVGGDHIYAGMPAKTIVSVKLVNEVVIRKDGNTFHVIEIRKSA